MLVHELFLASSRPWWRRLPVNPLHQGPARLVFLVAGHGTAHGRPALRTRPSAWRTPSRRRCEPRAAGFAVTTPKTRPSPHARQGSSTSTASPPPRGPCRLRRHRRTNGRSFGNQVWDQHHPERSVSISHIQARYDGRADQSLQAVDHVSMALTGTDLAHDGSGPTQKPTAGS